MKFISLIVVLMMSFAVKPVSATESSQLKLSNYLKNLESYSANFQQQVIASNGHLMDTSSGQFYMKRPNQFHWEIVKPYEQTILSDGQLIYSIDVDLEQITITDIDSNIANTPLFLLTRKNPMLSTQFHVTEYSDDDLTDDVNIENDKIERFLLKPTDQSANFEHIQLGFKAGILNLIELYDSLGQITIIKMSNSRRNPILGDHYFHFEMTDDTKDYDVIDSTVQPIDSANR